MSVRAVRRMGSPEVCRGHAEMPLEQMMEMAAVVIACRKGDIPDGKARAAQQACRLLHADVLKIFLKADAQILGRSFYRSATAPLRQQRNTHIS